MPKDEHENRTRLLDNQQATKANVESHLKQHSEISPIELAHFKASRDSILTDRSSQINKMIEEPIRFQRGLDVERDLALGIIQTVGSEEHDDHTLDLIRDARFQKELTKDDEDKGKDTAKRMSYAIQTLNTLQAAKKILEFEGKNDKVQEIEELAKERLKELFDKDKPLQKNKKFDGKVIDKLNGFGIPDVEKRMNSAKNFIAMDNQQYHVSTITTQKDAQKQDRLVVESNVMLLGTTAVQENQYKDKIRQNQDWYTKLSPFDRGLVDKYADRIGTGEVMIPTQLRKHLPGLRNAYSKSTFAETGQGTQNFDKVVETFHSGTVSFHGKGDKVAHTKDNIEQLETFMPAGKKATINPLNSPQLLPGIANPLNDIDAAAPGTIKKAQEQRGRKGEGVSVTPFNDLRKTTYNDNTGFDIALREIGGKLALDKNQHTNPNTHKIASFLLDGQNEQEARQQLQTLKGNNPQFAAALKRAVDAKHLIVNPHGMRDRENQNLELSSLMNIVSFHSNYNGIIETNIKDLDVDLILSHCASGKDRNGILQTKITHEALNDYFGLDRSLHHDIMEENLGTQIAGNHTQTLAGINGGTPGAHGVKDDSLSACPKGSQYADLIEDTAKGNKVKAQKSNKGKIAVAVITSPVWILPAIAVAALAVTATVLTAIGLGVVYGANKVAGYSPPSNTKESEKHVDVKQQKSQEQAQVVSRSQSVSAPSLFNDQPSSLNDSFLASDQPEKQPLLNDRHSSPSPKHEIVGSHTKKFVNQEQQRDQRIEVGGNGRGG